MKNRKKLVSILAGIMAVIMVLSLILSIIPTAKAASSSEIKNQITALQNKKKELEEKKKDLRADIETNEDEIAQIIAEKNVIDQEIGILYAEIITINDTISAYNLLIADKQDELDEAILRHQELNEQNRERVRTMEEEGALSYWSVLFKANSFSDLLDRLTMIEEIAAADQRRLKALREAAAEVETARDELAEEKQGIEETRMELAAAEAELVEKRAAADELIQELMAKGDDIHAMLHEMEDAEEELLEMISGKEQEYADAKASEEAAYWAAYWATYVPPTTAPAPTTRPTGTTSSATTAPTVPEGTTAATESDKNTESTQSTESTESTENTESTEATTPKAPASSASWIVPCSYRQFSSPFGERQSPTAGASSYHNGVDLAAPKGTPIVASRGGVVSARYTNAGGYTVSINHGDGFVSIYMHMDSYVVGTGQTVAQGDLIGYVGSTGISTGNHLHFGISYNGEWVNPAAYIPI